MSSKIRALIGGRIRSLETTGWPHVGQISNTVFFILQELVELCCSAAVHSRFTDASLRRRAQVAMTAMAGNLDVIGSHPTPAPRARFSSTGPTRSAANGREVVDYGLDNDLVTSVIVDESDAAVVAKMFTHAAPPVVSLLASKGSRRIRCGLAKSCWRRKPTADCARAAAVKIALGSSSGDGCG